MEGGCESLEDNVESHNLQFATGFVGYGTPVDENEDEIVNPVTDINKEVVFANEETNVIVASRTFSCEEIMIK